MLTWTLPDEPLIRTVRERICRGQKDEVLRQMATAVQEGCEVVILPEKPIPECFDWAFEAVLPSGDLVFVVHRDKTDLQIKYEELLMKERLKRELNSL